MLLYKKSAVFLEKNKSHCPPGLPRPRLSGSLDRRMRELVNHWLGNTTICDTPRHKRFLTSGQYVKSERGHVHNRGAIFSNSSQVTRWIVLSTSSFSSASIHFIIVLTTSSSQSHFKDSVDMPSLRVCIVLEIM